MAVHVPPRIYRRVPFATTVRLCYDRFRGFVEENSANLSLGGMFIQTDERPPVGTELSIEFRLEDGFELIRGTGRVTWVRDEPAGPDLPAGVGVRFLELTPGSRELIFRLVDRRVKEGKTPFDLDEAAPGKTAAPADAPATGPATESATGSAPAPRPEAPAPLPAAPAPLPEAWDPAHLPAALQADLAAASPAASLAGGPAGGPAAQEAPGSDPTPWGDPPPPDAPAEPPHDLPPPAEEPPRSDPPPGEDEPSSPPGRPPESPPEPPIEEPPSGPGSPSEPPSDRPPIEEPPREAIFAAIPVASIPVAATPFAATPAATPARSGPRWGRVALAATVALLVLAAGGTWWAQRSGLIGSENTGGVLGPLPLHPDEVAEPGLEVPPGLEVSPALDGAAEALDGAAPSSAATAAAGPEETSPASGETVEVAAPPGRPPTRLENLTWSAGGGRTDLLLWTDGAVGPGSYSHFRIAGERPRLVVRLRGIEQPYARGQVAVGTPQVERIRTGFHSDRQPSELHVVFDLPGSGVELTRIEGVGGRLRVVLEGS